MAIRVPFCGKNRTNRKTGLTNSSFPIHGVAHLAPLETSKWNKIEQPAFFPSSQHQLGAGQTLAASLSYNRPELIAATTTRETGLNRTC